MSWKSGVAVKTLAKLGTTRALRTSVAACALIASVGVVVATTDTPSTTQLIDRNGRSWLVAQTKLGRSAFLANGVSGRVEGSARSNDLPPELRFAGSSSRFTLLTSSDTAVVMSDGRHTLEQLHVVAEDLPTVAGSSLYTFGASPQRRSLDDGSVEPLALNGERLESTHPVVDDNATLWVPRSTADGPVVQRFSDDSSTSEQIDLPEDSAELLLVDGRATVRTRDELVALDTSEKFRSQTFGSLAPSVRRGSLGGWAGADGSEMRVGGSAAESAAVRAPNNVSAVAVWYGLSWFVAGQYVYSVGLDGGTPQQLPSPTATPLDYSNARMYEDGDRLWIVNQTVGVSVGPDQSITQFILADASADFCVGDCTTADIKKKAEEQPTTTVPPDASQTTTTTAPVPSIPPMTLPDNQIEPENIEALGTSTTLAQVTPSSVIAPIESTVVDTTTTTMDVPLDTAQDPPETSPLRTTTVAPTTLSPTTLTTTTTAPVSLPNDLKMSAVRDGGTLTVDYELTVNQPCTADGELKYTLIPVADGVAVDDFQSVAPAAGAHQIKITGQKTGMVSYELTLCGLTVTARTDPEALPGTLKELSVAPSSPEVGESFTISSEVTVNQGWVAKAGWWYCDGAKLSEQDLTETTTVTLTRSESSAGPKCFELRVAYTSARYGRGDRSVEGNLEVVNSTTTTSTTTSTTSTTLPVGPTGPTGPAVVGFRRTSRPLGAP